MCVQVVDEDRWKNMGLQAGLRQLKLSKNRLPSFPTCLPCLAPNLEVLDLSDNPLDGVIPVPDLPSSLTELKLSQCGLKDLNAWRKGADATQDMSCLGSFKMM